MTKILNYSTKFLLDSKGEGGEIKGYASVFGNRNYWGDIVERGAFTEFIDAMKNSSVNIPLIFEHKTGDVSAYIGTVETVAEDEKGLYITASLADTAEAKRVHELLEDNTLNAFSVGITATEYEHDGEGDRILKASLREVSIVLEGADPYAKIDKEGVPETVEAPVDEPAPETEPEQSPEQADNTSEGKDYSATAEPETVEDEPVEEIAENAKTEDNGEETTEETPEETEPKGEETPEPETEQADTEPEEETGETKDFSEEETSEDKEETKTVTEKEYSMTKIENPTAMPEVKKMTAGGALLKMMKAEPKKDAYELRTYTAGNADALKYNGAFQNIDDVVSLTGYTGVDYIDLFTVIETDSNSLTLTKVDYEGLPAITADAGLKAQIKATPTPISEVITKIAGYLSISSACVEDGLGSVVDADLAELLAIARNDYLVSTVLDKAGAATTTGNLWNDIVNNASLLRSKGAGALTLFVNPADTATLTAGNGVGCCGSIADTLGAFGITRIEYTTEVDAGKFVLGDFKAQRVYRRTPIRVERATQSEDHFIYDIDDYRVYQRLGLFVRRPDLLVKAA